MSLSYLSGIDSDYLGLAEVRKRRPQRSRAGMFLRNPSERAARIQAVRAAQEAKAARRAAFRAQQIAKMQTAAANEATQQALTADLGRKANRQQKQQAKQQKQEARQQQQQAKRAQAQAKKAAVKAQQATRKAQRAAAKTQKQATKQATAQARRAATAQRKAVKPAARAQRKQIKQANRTTAVMQRRKAVPAPLIRRKAPAPAPVIEEIEDMQAEEMMQEEPEEFIEDEADIFEPEMDSDEEDFTEDEDSMEGDFLGLDQIGNKAKRQARRGVKKQKRATKKAGKTQRKAQRKANKTARGGSRLKKVALAPARAAFTTLLRLNLLKTASKIAAGYKRNPEAVKKFAARFGFKWENFATAVSKGSKTQISGLGEPVTAGAILTAAAPIIAALPVLLKSLGVKMDKQTQEATRNAVQATKDNIDTAEDAEAREEGRPSRAGFKLSTPLLVGGAAAVLLLMNRK